MKTLITGSTGYVSSYLIPHLLADGHRVVGVDVNWFGDGFLPKDNPNYEANIQDIRDVNAMRMLMRGCDAVLHLGCVSNDHSCNLDPALSDSINMNAFEPLVLAAKEAGVKRFIYCSSSSVYGSNDAPEITEDMECIPLTKYNTFKAACEPVLLKHQSPEFECVIIRPATVCGYAPRMRFDLTVNVMTMHAMKRGKITIEGGQQKRPNLHIKDMVRCYQTMLEAPAEKVAGQTFNVGYRNMRVVEIAELIANVVRQEGLPYPEIEFAPPKDGRSYHINSDKIKNVLGFEPKHTVEDAIRDIVNRFQGGAWPDADINPVYSNVWQLVQKHGYGAKQ